MDLIVFLNGMALFGIVAFIYGVYLIWRDSYHRG